MQANLNKYFDWYLKAYIVHFHKCLDYQHLGKVYAGLPPEGPTLNPRRGSKTGSYGLPVPPEWLRSQNPDGKRKGRSGSRQLIMDGSFTKSRSGSIEFLPGWLGSVLSGTLGKDPTKSFHSGESISQKSHSSENKTPVKCG